MKHLQIEITGITPLLMNKCDEASLGGTKQVLEMKERGEPRDEADKTKYADEEGYLYIPGMNLFSCMIDAGTFIKVGRSKLSTQKSSLVPAYLGLNEERLLLLNKDGKKTKNFEVDSRPVVIPATKGRIMRHRARVDEWRLKFEIEYDKDEISSKLIRQLIDAAGKKVGLGDFRPSRRGMFGKFVVTNWKDKK